LPGELLNEYCIEPIRNIIVGIKARFPAIPIIVFAKGVGYRHKEVYSKTKCQAVGIEAECSLEFMQSILPAGTVIQGNLDPLLLFCDDDVVRKHTLELVKSISRDRHIFNLGHGIKPQTNPDVLTTIVKTIRNYDHG
jgi:uroporphyrinogen decarboxylase